MKQGVLVYDQQSERMDVRFGLEEYYGGLHCGTCMDVKVGNRWKPTRIEYDWGDQGVVLSWSSGKFFGRSDGSHGLKLNKILTTSVYSSLNGDWIDALFLCPKSGK